MVGQRVVSQGNVVQITQVYHAAHKPLVMTLQMGIVLLEINKNSGSHSNCGFLLFLHKKS
jgi:hypothetical protein